MNLDFPKLAQAANLALVRACRRLRKNGCDGEAARAWSMADRWREHAKLLITLNAERLKPAPARQVVRELSVVLCCDILKVELGTHHHDHTLA